MNILTRSFIVVFAFVVQIITPAYAEQLFCSTSTETSPHKTVVVYGNGVFNTRPDAQESLNALQDRLRAILPPEKEATLDFKLAYNQSVGLIADTKEAWRQKIESDNFDSLFWRMMSDTSAIPATLRNDYKERLTSLDAWGPLEKVDITAHLDLYRTSIRGGKKVIVVAHSQGNLFANKAYDILYSGDNALPTKSFGIIAVASPAHLVGGNGLHTTLETDHLIEGLRNKVAGDGIAPPLPWNVQNNPTGDDIEGHSFVGEYLLAGSLSESKILADILYTDNRLEKYSPSANAITISIISNKPLSMDFMKITPTGPSAGAATLTPIGASGWHELTDHTSCKTEVYAISYAVLSEGFYFVDFTNAHWQNPNESSLEVRAGSLVKSYPLPFSGSAGTFSMDFTYSFPGAGIEVTRNPVTQEYAFSIFSPLGDPFSAP